MQSKVDASKLELTEEIVDIRRVAKTVKGGRNMRFSVTVVVGDGEGHVGMGLGKAIEIPEAVRKATEDAKKKMKKWGKDRGCYLDYAEMQYKGVRRKIIVEEYLKPETGLVPADYKVYCFNGQPKFILVCVGRENDRRPKFYFFNENWELARINPDSKKAPEGFSYPRPSCFDKLMQSAKTLSAPFEFVRADFYVVNDKVYFGELTFTPAGGTDPNRLRETDLMFGNMLKI